MDRTNSRNATKRRDIRFGSFHLDWATGLLQESNDRMVREALDYAEQAIDWYLTRKKWKRLLARFTRLTAILLVLLGSLVPLLGEIFASNGKSPVSPLWASVALALAAGAIGIDRFFGYSASYMRYMTTAARLQAVMLGFCFESQSRTFSFHDREPSDEQIRASIEACQIFLATINQIIEQETANWGQDFSAVLTEIDKSARTQLEVGQMGAATISVPNGDACDNGWELIVDDGFPQRRFGKSAALRNLLLGAHTICVRGEIAGKHVTAERSFLVNGNLPADIAITLA